MPAVVDGWRRIALIAALMPLAMISSGAQDTQGGPIRLAWDANSEPVAGYRVHVGMRSREYTQIIDVRGVTTFTYSTTARGQRYFFAVSAYMADGAVSPVSSEVSATAAASPTVPLPTDPDLPDDQTSSRIPRGNDTAARVTVRCSDVAGCYDVRVATSGLDTVSGLAARPDGTLLIVEREETVKILSAGALRAAVALVAAEGSQIVDVVPDPSQADAPDVYLGVVQRSDDGQAAFGVIRYRLLRDRLSEPAVVISGLSARDGSPRLAMDGAGRLYVAMPAERHPTRFDAYAGTILRFNRDGTVPHDNRAASPILADGFKHPAGLDVRGAHLWARGRDDRWPDTLMHLDLQGSSAGSWPRTLEPALQATRAVASAARIDDVTAFIDRAQEVNVLKASTGVRHTISLRDGGDVMSPEAATSTPSGDIYVAVRSAEGSSLILRLLSRD